MLAEACGRTVVHNSLSQMMRRFHREDRAVAAYREALKLVEASLDVHVVADALDGLAALLAGGDPDRAARLAGAAQRARDDFGWVRPFSDRPVPDRVEPAWSEGFELSLEEARAYAVRDID